MNCCPANPSVFVPGPPGADGVNAFSTTTAAITLPPVTGSINVAMLNSKWLAINQPVFISDGTHQASFMVVSLPSATPFTSAVLQFLADPNDSIPGSVIAAGATVSPGGVQGIGSFPILVAKGGTGATVAPTALSNLGIAASGANSDITSLIGAMLPLSVNQGGIRYFTPGTSPYSIDALSVYAYTAGLTNGVVTVSFYYALTANSKIIVRTKTPAGTRTGFAGYKITNFVPSPAPASFKITAINDAGVTLNACADAVYFHIIG